MSDNIEKMIAYIDSMLLKHMDEDSASVILNKVRLLAELAGGEGYSQGYDDKQAEVDEDMSL